MMESLQVWRNQKKPLRGFFPSLKEKYFFSLRIFLFFLKGKF